MDLHNLNILVIGGAGYLGSTLVPMLLKSGAKVRVLDRLLFGGTSLLTCFSNKNFELVVGDIRNKEHLNLSLKKIDVIVNFAAIVGYPACEKDPELAWYTNLEAAVQLNHLRSRNQMLIFASTGSNYGHCEIGLCSEKTQLNPLGVYGETKVKAEENLLSSDNVIVHRYSTAFGLSPRMRLDLMLNDFVYTAQAQQHLIIYEGNHKRSFIHVKDISRAIIFSIKNNKKMIGDVFNIGNESMNKTKKELALMVSKNIKCKIHFFDSEKDTDQRTYFVNFSKIKKLGYLTSKTINQGINEMSKAFPVIRIYNPFVNV